MTHELEVAERALAIEHEAVYAFGVVGGVLEPGTAEAGRALDGYDAHRARRDRLEDAVQELGGGPAPAEPGYVLPAPVTDVSSAARLARRVEDRSAVAYAQLVGSSVGGLRAVAVDWLTDAATRGLSWGAAPTAFPGLASSSGAKRGLTGP